MQHQTRPCRRRACTNHRSSRSALISVNGTSLILRAADRYVALPAEQIDGQLIAIRLRELAVVAAPSWLFPWRRIFHTRRTPPPARCRRRLAADMRAVPGGDVQQWPACSVGVIHLCSCCRADPRPRPSTSDLAGGLACRIVHGLLTSGLISGILLALLDGRLPGPAQRRTEQGPALQLLGQVGGRELGVERMDTRPAAAS